MSWSWKDTLVDNILSSSDKFTKLVSTTTREKRDNEIEWKSYKFITNEEFNTWFKKGRFFQYSKFAGNTYAYEKEELFEKISKKNVLLISHPQSISLITFFLEQNEIEYTTVYLDISQEVWLQRMKSRGDSETSIKWRLEEREEFVWYKKKADIVIDSSISKEHSLSEFLKNI